MKEVDLAMVELDPMSKMWASFIAIGLMAVAAIVVTFARVKTRGIIRIVLTAFAFICLLLSIVYGLISIL